MSMISSLIDELNKSADEWNSSNMFELARMCRDAADTICELRGALQVASVDYRHLAAENEKLREQCADMDERHAKTFEVGKRWMAKAARFESENTKLRELVADAWGYISHPANATWTHEKRKEVRHSLSDRMRKLGVDVDEWASE